MEQFVQEIMPAILQLLATIILGLIGWMVPKVKKYFDDKGISQKLEQYDYLAEIAVRAVEQIYQNEDGTTKKQKTKEFIVGSMDNLGLDITPQQLDMFIESAVKRVKDEWTEVEIIDDQTSF